MSGRDTVKSDVQRQTAVTAYLKSKQLPGYYRVSLHVRSAVLSILRVKIAPTKKKGDVEYQWLLDTRLIYIRTIMQPNLPSNINFLLCAALLFRIFIHLKLALLV